MNASGPVALPFVWSPVKTSERLPENNTSIVLALYRKTEYWHSVFSFVVVDNPDDYPLWHQEPPNPEDVT